MTGITEENQSTIADTSTATTTTITNPITFSSSLSVPPKLTWTEFVLHVPALIETIQGFALERQWTKYHTPRNLVLALMGEVGELAEIVQWKDDTDITTDDAPTSLWSISELDRLSQEIADVSIYLLRLVSVTNVTEALLEHLRQQNQ